VAVGSQVFFDNGNITGVIAEIDKHLIEVEIKNDGWIYESQQVQFAQKDCVTFEQNEETRV
jgi:pyruvate kinase